MHDSEHKNTMTNPIINPKFHALIPSMSADELAQLEANIAADGCREPLVTWNGTLLDGHNRLEICQRLGLPFTMKEISLPDEPAAERWIIRNQFGRRNLTAYDRAVLALKLEPLLKAEAKKRLATSTGGDKARPICSEHRGGTHPTTQKALATAAHVSNRTIAKVKIIEARATPEVKAAIRAGESTIAAEHEKLTVHVGHNSGENEWYTPKAIIEAARSAMGTIDCDPASSEIANRTVKADVFFDKKANGLDKPWGQCVFVNPPYAQPLIAKFSKAVCSKFKSGEVKQAIVLVNNATETAWCQELLETASAVCFIKSRVKFLDPKGKPGAPLQGQIALCLGKQADKFKDAFAAFGPIFKHDCIR